MIGLQRRPLASCSGALVRPRACQLLSPVHRVLSQCTSRSSKSQQQQGRRSVFTRASTDWRPESPQPQLGQQPAEGVLQQLPEAASDARCPFAHDSSSTSSVPASSTSSSAHEAAGSTSTSGKAALSNEPTDSTGSDALQEMHGPGWRVLPPATAHQLPEVPGRPVTVDEANPMGEFGEFDALGAGAFLLERYKEFGPIFSWQMGPTKMITMVDYEAIKSLLQADGKVIKAWNPDSFYMMMGENLRETMEIPANRLASRRLMQPGFAKEAMPGYLDKLATMCKAQLEEWASTQGPINLAARGKDLTFDLSTQLLVDFDIPAEQKPALRAKFDALFKGMFSPPDPTPGSRFSRGIEARSQLLQDLVDLVKTREAKLATAEQANNESRAHKSVFDYTLDDLRAQNDGKVDYHAAAGSALALIIGGNDASGTGLSTLLATISLFPGIVAKLKDEQEHVVARLGPAITSAALDAMPYADAVIREVLRVIPPSPSIFRQTTANMEVCGKFVPAGVPILLSLLVGQVLTDPHLQVSELSRTEFQALQDNWASVNAALLKHEFKPERWLQADTSMQRPSGLLTFGAGPHVCLGMSLFFTEAKVLLALLARDYDITSPQDSSEMAFKMDFNSHLKQGVVMLSKRDISDGSGPVNTSSVSQLTSVNG